MTENLKRGGFLAKNPRFFTQAGRDGYHSIQFVEIEEAGDESWPALESPADWSSEATALLRDEAALADIPGLLKSVEENTVPSWLWRKSSSGPSRSSESSVRQIFDRVVGSACYTGWKQGLFANEDRARSFFDEARAMLVSRAAAFEPAYLKGIGLAWAYGMNEEAPISQPLAAPRRVEMRNIAMDAIVRGSPLKAGRSRGAAKVLPRSEGRVTFSLSDIAADWGDPVHVRGPSAVIDLMAFRHNDGWVNVEGLRHAVRLLVQLFDLQNTSSETSLEIGFCNLAPLLMALALPYDSDAARAVAGALSAIITAEGFAASSELASLRGQSAGFRDNRETIMRALRNHRRAAYGERTDYEKMSVAPSPLTLQHAPDLPLVAAAQRRWDEVLDLARSYGLRHSHHTGFKASPSLSVFMETSSFGIETLDRLSILRPMAGGLFGPVLRPSVAEGLSRLGYNQQAQDKLASAILGHRSLTKAPRINTGSLRAHGFDSDTLAKVEAYIPQVNTLRLAFTPWVVGEAFCRSVLKISAARLGNPRFDLLRHLGYSPAEISLANAWCYGSGSLRSASELKMAHRSVFAVGDEVPVEARVRMAAAVQSFISGDVALSFSLPVGAPREASEFLLLSAWRQGVKSVTVTFDPGLAGQRVPVKTSKKMGSFLHAKGPTPLPSRARRLKAGSRIVSMGSKEKGGAPLKGKRT